MHESATQPSPTEKSCRTTLHYVIQSDGASDLVLPPAEELWLPLRRHLSCVRMRTNHIATKCNYYARLLN